MNRINPDEEGVVIIGEDGCVNWYDPIIKGSVYMDHKNNYVIENGFGIWYHPVDEVKEIRYYPICNECGYEIDEDDWCSYDCPLTNQELK